MQWFELLTKDEYKLIGSLPPDCIEDCSGQSQNPEFKGENVVKPLMHWISKLNFNPDSKSMYEFLEYSLGLSHVRLENHAKTHDISIDDFAKIALLNKIALTLYNRANSPKARRAA